MAKLKLTCALSANPRTKGIAEGQFAGEGIELEVTTLHPSEMFFRQLKYAEFDVSEMSCSSLSIMTAQGPTQWVGIPVFTSRQFFHTNLLIRTDRGIEKPQDLAGKRVGVAEFQQTASVWTRAALRSEFGVDPRSLHWYMERNPDQSHGGATGFVPPPGIDLQYIPKTKDIGQMLIDGELDAGRWINAHNLIDRSNADPLSSPNVRYLFDPPEVEAKRYYAKTNIYPINHCVVVRRSIVEKYPWVVLNLYSMFGEVKVRNARSLDATLEPYYESGLIDAAAKATLHKDVMPYGIKANRHVLETITQTNLDDGLVKRKVGLEEMFSPNTLDL
jgi:4,5-dihydroxyphthalate decarboxylase